MRVYLAAPTDFYQPKQSREGRARLRHVLLSFVVRSWGADKFQNVLANTQPTHGFCVDSGAHTWMSLYHKTHVKPPMAAVEAAIEKFSENLRTLVAGGDRPRFMVDLDVQKIYGLPTINAWRRDIWQPLEKELETPVCYVWHPADGEARWTELLDAPEVRYLGMGSSFSLMPISEWARLVRRAYAAGKPVHGFAKIHSRYLREIPFYSVDSVSWAGGPFFGYVSKFDAVSGKMRQLKVGDRSLQEDGNAAVLSRLAKAAGGKIPISLIRRGSGHGKDYTAFYTNAIEQYARFEEWHTAYWIRRGIDWEGRLLATG